MVVIGLDVDADEISACVREGFDVVVGAREHQVGVKKKRVTVAAEGGDGFGTERQVRDKVAVHDVDVQPFQAEFCDGGGAGGKVRVIAGKERRGE
jgi:hypothetical protein